MLYQKLNIIYRIQRNAHKRVIGVESYGERTGPIWGSCIAELLSEHAIAKGGNPKCEKADKSDEA